MYFEIFLERCIVPVGRSGNIEYRNITMQKYNLLKTSAIIGWVWIVLVGSLVGNRGVFGQNLTECYCYYALPNDLLGTLCVASPDKCTTAKCNAEFPGSVGSYFNEGFYCPS